MGNALSPAHSGRRVSAPSDAALLALCANFHRLHHEVYARLRADDPAWEALYDERWEVSDKLLHIRPRTEVGKIAKASVALALMEEDTSNDGSGGSVDDFVLVTLRDLAGCGKAVQS